MDPYKTNRLNAAIQKTLGELIETQVKDPRVGFVTIVGVHLNRDHSVARVFFSVLGDDEEREKSITGLHKAAGFLQSQVGKALRLRTTPELRFEYDGSLDRGLGVESVLRDLSDQGEFLSEDEKRRRLTLADFVPDSALLAALRGATRVWVIPHWNPDPDAAGCALALVEALQILGKEALSFRFPDPPVGLVGLPGWNDLVPHVAAPELLASAPPDLAVLVDCHRTDRTGEMQDTLDRLPQILCIDHHLISGRRAPVPGWIDARAEANATLVHQVVAALLGGVGESLTTSIATNLFAGLTADTGGFRFRNTTPMTFDLARSLAACGVDVADVTHRVLHLRRREGLALLQQALGTCEFTANGRVVTARASLAMFAETSASPSETEGFVNLLTAVAGVRYAAFLKEIEPDLWRASMRAMGDGDVQAIAAQWGGGGHRAAAGCTIEGDGDSVAAAVAAALSDLL